MENSQSDYQDKYNELNLLGRGNYGSAYVVQSQINGKLFVAKKMNLDGMTQAQIQAAKGQIEILQKFNDNNLYPFIVKYNECFVYDKTLVIIMEYCEHGDLAGFLKYAKKKGELLDQKIILAWFVMLIMGIQALHSKNVLHRDLKSANIFLTSNKYIKIGDFGISKVLETTSAKTFVGTPYYLSPQVCSNKKYDFKSDIWSLGCILYELCTLNYPFQANNILSLAMKITNDQVQPIPDKYSKQLQLIVNGLLTKDKEKRKTLQQILQMPYMQNFLAQNGNQIQKICENLPLKKAQKFQSKVGTSTLKGESSDNSTAQDTMKTIQSNFQRTTNNDTLSYSQTGTMTFDDDPSLTPKQRMQKRKQRARQQEEMRLKQHLQQNYMDQKNFVKSMKKEQLGNSGSNFGRTANKTLQKKYQQANIKMAEQKKSGKNDMNSNQDIDLKQLSELTKKMNTLGITSQKVDKQIPKEIKDTLKKDSQIRAYVDQPVQINEQIQEQLQEYYDEQFQDYIPEQEQKEQAKEELQAVKAFVSVISGNTAGMSPSKKKNVEKAFEKREIKPRTQKQKLQDFIQECIQIVGEQNYKYLYEMSKKNSPELNELRKKGSKAQRRVISLIQQINYLQGIV